MNEALRAFLRDPPAGSKTRAALDFGIDLTLTVRNAFTLTPAERLERMQRDQIGDAPRVVARAEPDPRSTSGAFWKPSMRSRSEPD